MKIEPCKVDNLLRDIDYDWNGYIPTKEALQFAAFIKEVGEEENTTPLMHLSMMDQVFNTHPRNAILVHRGGAKSVLFAEMLTLFKGAFNKIPGFGKTNLSLFVGDSIENGVKNLRRNVEFRYANSDYLQWLIPNKKIIGITADEKIVEGSKFIEEAMHGGYKFTDVRVEFKNRSGGHHITKCYGVKTGIKGVKELGQRPVDATFDDIIKGDDDARSKTIITSIKNTIYKDVAYALHPKKSKMIYLGTPYNQNDPLYKAIESGSWTRAVYPVCKTFPCTREEFRGSWSDRFTFDYVKDMYETALSNGEPQSFFQELMLRTTSEEDRLIPDELFTWYDSTEEVEFNKKAYNFIITSDFSVSGKEHSDLSVLLVWAIDEESNLMLVNGFAQKCRVDVSIDQLFEFVKHYNASYYPTVGIEVSGQQRAIVTMIEQKMLRDNIFFPLAREKGKSDVGIYPRGDKITRLNSVVPYFRLSKIRFPKNKENLPWMVELMNELKSVTNAGYSSVHDDLGDAVAMLGQMVIVPPSVRKKEEKTKIITSVRDIYDDLDDIDPKSYSALDSYIN